MPTKKKIVILQGHPDSSTPHLCHTLAQAYADGARDGGHDVSVITVSDLDFPMLRSSADWTKGTTPEGLVAVQQELLAANHLMVIFPLWLGSLPALLKGFFEQIFRPSLMPDANDMRTWHRLMKGSSARVVVTMGMPAIAYRLFFRAHGVKFFTRNVLAFSGCGPIRTSYIGMVEQANKAKVESWKAQMKSLGAVAR